MENQYGLRVKMVASAMATLLLLNVSAFSVPQESSPSNVSPDSVARQSAQSPPDSTAVPFGSASNSPVSSSPASSRPANEALPDSPGAVRAPVPSSQPPAQGPIFMAQQQPPRQISQEPVGTAAAESIPTVGVAASRPAGAALAPGKQRRVRSILIKVGAVVGVGVAVGTTMALSEGSSSRPPGAR
jgi:hypothetical protein